MYRLLSLPKMKIIQLSGVTTCNNDKISKIMAIERTCTLCKQSFNISPRFSRCQSTNTSPNMKPPRKKRLRGVKKYVELLEITEKSTTEHKAKIRKLTSDDLHFLASTNLNLSELHKLKEMMKTNRTFEEHTYNNLAIIENIPDIAENATNSDIDVPVQSVIVSSINSNMKEMPHVSNSDKNSKVRDILGYNNQSTERNLSQNLGLKPIPILDDLEPFQEVLPSASAFQPEALDEESHETVEAEDNHVKEQKGKGSRIDLEAKHEVISKTLAALIEMCCILKHPHQGLKALSAYSHKSIGQSHFPSLTNINVYNAALKGFASAGNFEKLQEIIKFIRNAQINLNVQSYVAIFECLGRCNVDQNHLREIRIYSKEAKWNGFCFDRILNEGIFLNDERKYVLNAMWAYDKNYIPYYKPPDIQYNNSLLDNLNNDEQLKYKDNSVKTPTGIFQQKKMQKIINEQIEIEKQGYVTVKNIENKEDPTPEILKYREAFNDHLKIWETTASKAFNRDLNSLSEKKAINRLEPFMKSIPIQDFTNIIIDEAKFIAQGSETYSPTAYLLYKDLGLKVYSRFKVLRKNRTGVLDKVLKIHTKYCNDYAASHNELDTLPTNLENVNSRQKWQWIEFNEKPEGASIELDHQQWVPSVLQAVGKFLYNIIMHDLKVDANVVKGNNKDPNYVPAFYTIFRHHGRIVKEEVKPHPILSKLYRSSSPETLTFHASSVPMKCPPIPWSSLNIGGYLVTHTDFVRLPSQALTQKQRLKECDLNQLYPSFDALNQLGAVPWKVNRKILDCILKVFIDGGSSKLCVPEHPSSLPAPVAPITEMDKQQKYSFFRQKLQYRRRKAEMYSLWCDCLYRLSLANHFKDNIFWLPHNMDFRGRVYPVPPHLNHLGSDLARSMLVFAEARPLGPKGLDWLKLHLINLTGLKKRDSLNDRLIFANEIIDKILDSADFPLTGKMWWASSDEPWQTLACCMEIADAIRSPNPKKFRSHFPVHQDGSCNGLQHYAALGRDRAGGYSVNLSPASKPQDVYSSVATLVEEKRQKDEENGVEIAKILRGFVRRKVIKQTVMTTVYGVTRFGARLQIARQLKDIDDFPKDSVWAGSAYLTARTFESLRTMFTSTREIQDWFTDCARLISSVCGKNVEWVTPLGLPIVQPYFKYRTLPVNSVCEAYHMDKYEKPNVMKQKNAFPPNFIHSLDSSHMMLTSLDCERAGITFVSVHDCYWTHPSTVHIMNKICREQFVALHSEPILENLTMFFSDKYSYNSEDITCDGSTHDLAKRKLNKVLTKLPKTGNLNIEDVLNSVYFFS